MHKGALMAEQNHASALAPRLAADIRDKLIAGEFKPGQRLSEPALSADLEVSRNSPVKLSGC